MSQIDGAEPLPCDVLLPPHTVIRKGCSISTLVVAIQQRRQEGWPLNFDAGAANAVARSIEQAAQQKGRKP